MFASILSRVNSLSVLSVVISRCANVTLAPTCAAKLRVRARTTIPTKRNGTSPPRYHHHELLCEGLTRFLSTASTSKSTVLNGNRITRILPTWRHHGQTSWWNLRRLVSGSVSGSRTCCWNTNPLLEPQHFKSRCVVFFETRSHACAWQLFSRRTQCKRARCEHNVTCGVPRDR